MTSELQVHPELEHLREEIEKLREELTATISERDQLSRAVIPNLEAEYQLKIGCYEYEEFCLDVEIRRLRRYIHLVQVELNRGQWANREAIESRLEREFMEWQEKLREAADRLKKAERWAALPKLSAQDSAEVRRLYRALARKLHPDVNPDLPEEAKTLWLLVSEAYQNGDLEQLRSLSLLAEDLQGDWMSRLPGEASAVERLLEYRRALKQQIRAAIAEIGALIGHFPYTERDHLADERWVAARRTEILRQIEALQDKKAALEAMLEGLFARNDHEHGYGLN